MVECVRLMNRENAAVLTAMEFASVPFTRSSAPRRRVSSAGGWLIYFGCKHPAGSVLDASEGATFQAEP
jgi:N-acetylmuramic acid 6-phosphate (MurNAc-6-P) etherase